MKKAYALSRAALLPLPLAIPAHVNAADLVLEGPGVKSGVVFNNDKKLTLESKTKIIGGHIHVPVKEVSEKFGLSVQYDGSTHSAYILDNANMSLAQAEKGETMNLFRNNEKLGTTVVVDEENKAYIPAADFAKAIGRFYYEDTLSNSLYMFDDAAPMKDGAYVAVGITAPNGWTPQVNIEVKDGKIVSVVYDEYNAEGNGKKTDEKYNASWQAKYPEVILADKIDTLQNDLVAKQNPYDVDVATGATSAYNKFVDLTKKAMAQAKAANVSKAVNFEYRDGKYVVVGTTGYGNWTPQVDMEVKDGKIVSVEYTAYNDKGENKRLDGGGYVTNWKNRTPDVDPVAIIAEREAQLIKTQDPNMVDVSTGATGWASDLKLLTVGALNQARMADIEVTEDSTIYVFHGAPTAKSAYYVQLLALEKDGEIVDLDYVEYQTGADLAKPHNPTYLSNWAGKTADVLQGRNQLDIRQQMMDFIMENKSVEGIDAITGATNWRKGVVDLGQKALDQLQK